MSSNDLVEVYLLASGWSERMGASKPMLPFGRRTVLSRIGDAFSGAGLDRIRVIGRPDDHELARESFLLGYRYIINLEPERGMSGSVLEALNDCRSAWLALCPCDHPLLTATTIKLLAQNLDNTVDAVQPIAADKPRHPVFLRFGATLELRTIINEGGTLRDFLRKCNRRFVQFHSPEEFCDMDTPEDYARLLALVGLGVN